MKNWNEGTCRSCGAEIIWADIGGKRIPLNKRRVRAYRRRMDQDPDGHIHEIRGENLEPALFHISHFVTCPNASEHGKRKPAG